MSRNLCLIAAGLVLLAAPVVTAGTIDWADWTSATVGNPGSAEGNLPGHGISASYTGEVVYNTQTSGGGTDYWNTPSTPYLVPNSPSSTDIIILADAATTVTNTITFSAPVLNPVMAIMSLGRPSSNFWVEYTFDRSFDVILSGTGHWGGASTGSLFELPGNVLRGQEGHGVIQFQGSVSSISWTDTPSEFWHGFTVGIEGLAPAGGVVPVPSPLLLGGLGLIGLALRRRVRR